MKNLSLPVKISVCADGFVSIYVTASERRLKAALPVHSTKTVEQALMLIQKVCIFKACSHKGKIGTTVEAWLPGTTGKYEDLEKAAKIFQEAEPFL